MAATLLVRAASVTGKRLPTETTKTSYPRHHASLETIVLKTRHLIATSLRAGDRPDGRLHLFSTADGRVAARLERGGIRVLPPELEPPRSPRVRLLGLHPLLLLLRQSSR